MAVRELLEIIRKSLESKTSFQPVSQMQNERLKVVPSQQLKPLKFRHYEALQFLSQRKTDAVAIGILFIFPLKNGVKICESSSSAMPIPSSTKYKCMC